MQRHILEKHIGDTVTIRARHKTQPKNQNKKQKGSEAARIPIDKEAAGIQGQPHAPPPHLFFSLSLLFSFSIQLASYLNKESTTTIATSIGPSSSIN